MKIDFLQEFAVCLWDFDGTLFDTLPDIKDAWRQVFQMENLACPDFEEKFHIGPPLRDIVVNLFPGAEEQFILDLGKKFGEVYDRCGYPRTMPYSGVEALLRNLLSLGKKHFIVTNKRLKPVEILLKRFHWEELFSGICAAPPGAVSLSKAQKLAGLLNEHGIVPSTAVMIGDSSGDISAGQACGTATCGVAWGCASVEELQRAKADYILNLKDISC